MSSSSSTNQRSNQFTDDLSTAAATSTGFAPLHRTVELENLHESISNDNDKQSTTSTKKTLTKCVTVIGDGSDKQI